MSSKHALEDQRLIDSLPTGVFTAFRSSIYKSTYVTANAHLFITHGWIDPTQLRNFLKRGEKSRGQMPISSRENLFLVLFSTNHPCEATRTVCVPVDPSTRKAIIVRPTNTPHNHPMPALTKASFELKASYRECIKAAGCVGATVAKLRPRKFCWTRKLLRGAKTEAYPAGLDAAGAFRLFWGDMKKPIDERYVQRHDARCFETDTTFRRVAGKINEREVVIFLKALERRGILAVTIARAYVNGAIKLQLNGKPAAFKRFVAGGNILAMSSDMEAAQPISSATIRPGSPEIMKLCTTHAKRAALDFKKLEDFSNFVRGLGVKKIQGVCFFPFPRTHYSSSLDWWDHKAMSSWILPCLIKPQSPMGAEDWDSTPATTNTGVKPSVVEAIESGRKLDERAVREVETSIQTGILVDSQNEPSHRMGPQRDTAVSPQQCARLVNVMSKLMNGIASSPRSKPYRAHRNEDQRSSKALKAQKSAVGKGSTTESNTLRTVFVSANSSGRIGTKIIGIVLLLGLIQLRRMRPITGMFMGPLVQPMASTSAAPHATNTGMFTEFSMQPTASTSAAVPSTMDYYSSHTAL
ncbi:hypothetical protein C8R44DRAFT_886280 [Mycena epipterygia]|nr:hypothetical protein C8R44DRAFT_886280 [Mycena epipterygia]